MDERIECLFARAMSANPEVVDSYISIEGGIAMGYAQFQSPGVSTPYRWPHFAVRVEGKTTEQIMAEILAQVEG